MFKIIYLLIYSIVILHNYSNSSSFHFKNLNKYLKSKITIPSIDWLHVIGKITNVIDYISTIKLNNIDLTAGRIYISNPELYINNTLLIEQLSSYPNNLSKSILLPSTSSINNDMYEQKSTLLKIHQFSTKVIKKIPDNALIGALTLIGTELIKREVTKQSSLFPPIMQELANKTLLELDLKLEMITSMQYDIDPFLKLEYQRLQSQPTELMV